MIGAAVALMTKLRNSMSISFFNMVIFLSVVPVQSQASSI
jgi:hypothetical protein